MSEQYRCKSCGYVFDMKDMMCSECGVGYLERLRWTKGGDGSHFEGCEDVHLDCRIAQLEAELARRDELIKRLVEDAKALAIMPYYTNDIRDLGVGGYCRYCHKSQESGHADFCEIVLHRALMQELEKEATDADN